MGNYQSRFNKEIDRLFRAKTHRLRYLLESGKKAKGRSFDRDQLNKGIKELKKIASDALIQKYFLHEFKNRVEEKSSWFWKRSKGSNRDLKAINFKKWYKEKFSHHKCIYIYWNKRKCLYVGKTGAAPGRIVSHFDHIHFARTTRIEIYLANGKRDLSVLECMGIHKFRPTINQVSAAKKKYTAECPLCRIHRSIDKELRKNFVLRKR